MNPKDPTQIVKLCSKHLTHWVTSAHFNMLNNTRMCAIAIHSKPVPSPSQHITVWLQSDLFKKWCSPVGYVRYPHTLKSWWQIKWPISFPALPAENMHILIMHWCASWCSIRAISPSGFFLELGFTGFFFPWKYMLQSVILAGHLWTLHLSGTVGLGRQAKITVCRQSHHKAATPAQSLQFADSSVLAVQTSDTEHYVTLFKK